MRERGLKREDRGDIGAVRESLPMRERGLKPHLQVPRLIDDPSLPMRERGLKRVLARVCLDRHLVAPHAGAWIETSYLR